MVGGKCFVSHDCYILVDSSSRYDDNIMETVLNRIHILFGFYGLPVFISLI